MRNVGTFETEKKALRFWSYLNEKGIKSSLEEDEEEKWSIWVVNEECVKEAHLILQEFRENPENPKFSSNHSPPKLSKQNTQTATENSHKKGFQIIIYAV